MALYDHPHLGRISSGDMAVRGKRRKEIFVDLSMIHEDYWNYSRNTSLMFIYWIIFRWASILKLPRLDGSGSGLWCCMAPEIHLTQDFRRLIHTRNWRSSRRLTKNVRPRCNQKELHDFRNVHIERERKRERDTFYAISIYRLRIWFLQVRKFERNHVQRCVSVIVRWLLYRIKASCSRFWSQFSYVRIFQQEQSYFSQKQSCVMAHVIAFR